MNRLYVRRALVGGTVALLSTSVAAIAYGAYDMNTWSPAILIYAPLMESLIIGLAAGLVLGSVRRGFRPVVFAVLSLVVGGALGFVTGQFRIGESPHFSHNLAITFLSTSWSIGALIGACVVGFMSPYPQRAEQ